MGQARYHQCHLPPPYVWSGVRRNQPRVSQRQSHSENQAFGAIVQFDFGITLNSENLFDQRGAKTSSLGRLDRRPVVFMPAKVDDARVGRSCNRPMHIEAPVGSRERTKFRGVGGKFMKSHADRDGYISH